MRAIGDLQDAIEAAGIPLPDGLSRSRDGVVTIIGDTPHLTAEQRRQAEAIIAAFDWTEPPPKARNVLAEIYMATDLETRTNVWNDILGAMILDRVASHPDQVQAILDARGVNVRIREEQG